MSSVNQAKTFATLTDNMIKLTKINGEPVWYNMDHIESIIKTPDTIMVLMSGKKLAVKEPPEIIVDLMLEKRKKCFPIIE